VRRAWPADRGGARLLVTALLLGGAMIVRAEPRRAEGFDIVVENGRIVDGSGNAWFYGDVAIRGDTIAAIAQRGAFREAHALRRINAKGLVVAPGFIDALSSSDRAFLLGDGRSVSKLTQGITTEILGEGWNDAPISALTLASAQQLGIEGDGVKEALSQFNGPEGFGHWLAAMERHGISPNVGSFLGAMTIRAYAMGMAMRAPTTAETATMHEVVRHAMLDGALGIGSALIYPPGSYASTSELVDLCKLIAPFGGIYSTHIRSEGDRLLDGLDEAVTIGREAGVPVEIYHLKAAGRRNWDKESAAIARINDARAAGQDVQANMYPYEAGGTSADACFPPWAAANGNLPANLKDPEPLRRIKAEMHDEHTGWENICQLATPEGVVLFGLTQARNMQFNGQSLAAIAAQMHVDWVDALARIVLDEPTLPSAMFFLASEENVQRELQLPWMKFVTDSSGEAPSTAEEVTHPRAYGTFPRILGRYVRDQHLMTLEDAVRKMSSAVAVRLGIERRGLIAPGYFADLAIFDAERIRDRATYTHPARLSDGIRFVLVNGVVVVENGVHTGAKPGRVVRGRGFHAAAATGRRADGWPVPAIPDAAF
jgi:N-acyl-D-amino-acid deacylase